MIKKMLLWVGFVWVVSSLALCVSFVAWSAPFLVCDAYPADQAQPTEFVVVINGLPEPIITPALDVSGGKAMKLDLGPLNLSGSRQLTARARNAWGESANSHPFFFIAGPPVQPTGITLSVIE